MTKTVQKKQPVKILYATTGNMLFVFYFCTCQGRSQSNGIGNAPTQAPITAATQLMKQPHSTVAFRLCTQELTLHINNCTLQSLLPTS